MTSKRRSSTKVSAWRERGGVSWSAHGQWATTNIARWTAIIWTIELVNVWLGHRLILFGIYPRTWRGLYGVCLGVFIHASPVHLLVNTTPLIVLGWILGLSGPRVFYLTNLWIIVLGGLAVWLFGRDSLHLGSSTLVFGYFGYLVARALFTRNPAMLVLAALIVFYYGSMVAGVIPGGSTISWESHLFGLLAGVVAAWNIHGRVPVEP